MSAPTGPHAPPDARRVVLVTGGTQGVGRGIAERFCSDGDLVVVCGRTEPESVPGPADNPARFLPTDVRDPDAIGELFNTIEAEFGPVSVLINNAGGSPADAADASPRFSEAIIRLNLLGPLHASTRANATMQGLDDGGVIINIASVSAERPSPGTSAYGAAKAGVLSLTRTLAMEWAPKVRVVAVTCGMIATEKAHLFYGDEEAQARVASTVPLGRLGTPADVAAACAFLASSDASYISGSSLLLHGGGEPPPFLDAVG